MAFVGWLNLYYAIFFLCLFNDDGDKDVDNDCTRREREREKKKLPVKAVITKSIITL